MKYSQELILTQIYYVLMVLYKMKFLLYSQGILQCPYLLNLGLVP